MRYLLDTSAVLAHYRQEAGWEAVQALFEDEAAELSIASPTLTELGRRLRDLGGSERFVADAIDAYRLLVAEVVPVDAAVATRALLIGWAAKGRLPLVDALIATAAAHTGSVLVHRDPHMATIPTELVPQKTLG